MAKAFLSKNGFRIRDTLAFAGICSNERGMTPVGMVFFPTFVLDFVGDPVSGIQRGENRSSTRGRPRHTDNCSFLFV